MKARTAAAQMLPPLVTARLGWWKYLIVGELEIHELARLLPATGVAIDVGANVGYYSKALKLLGLDVVSFEPDQTYRKRQTALLGARARIESVALSDANGEGVIRVPQTGSGDYGGSLGSLSQLAVPDDLVASSYRTPLRTLDSYGFEGVVFIKIDVEGYEEAVLAGGMETLIRFKPLLLIEIEERHNPRGLERISKNLAVLGYEGFFYYERKRRNLADFNPVVHQRIQDIETSPRQYVNNFFWRAPDSPRHRLRNRSLWREI